MTLGLLRDWLRKPFELGQIRWILLFVGLILMLAVILFPIFLRAGFPPPSPCVTDRAFLEQHARECALGAYDPAGLQTTIDKLYLSGDEWVASLLVAIASAFFGALVLVTLVHVLVRGYD